MPVDVLQVLRTLNSLRQAANTSLTPAAQEAVARPLARAVWTSYHENVLGTSAEIMLLAANRYAAEQAEAALLAVIDRENLLLSAWKPDSELSRWLATRGVAMRLSPELLEVLALFDHWRTMTDGALNASAETAARVWQSAAAERRLPSAKELSRAVVSMQRTHWRIGPAHGTATHLTDSPLVLATFVKSYIAGHATDAALRAGAAGVSLNIGGDIVVRGEMAQRVDIADPFAAAENATPFDSLLLRERAIATSGSYRRGFSPKAGGGALRPEFSHILDPRTGQPTGHVLSSSVIARDPTTAGALATAFSVLGPEESRHLATKIGGVEYLLLMQGGERIASEGWSSYQIAQAPRLRAASYRAPAGVGPAAAESAWNQSFELDINIELARISDFRFHRPYIAVWIEDENHTPVRTLALWFGKMRYLPELHSWYRAAERGNGEEIVRTISSPTRSPGRYTLKWDGKDDAGKFVKAGKYTVCIEAAREHGTYQIQRQQMDFGGNPQQMTLAGGTELGATTLDYHKR